MILMGTGTSIGVPVVGCCCDVCVSENPKNKRMRSGVLVKAPEGSFVIDTGPELRMQLLRENARLVEGALFTHAHADHIMGLDDLRICSFQLATQMPLYCEEPVEQQLIQTFGYAFSDPSTHSHPHAVPRLRFERLTPGQSIRILGLDVLPIRLRHGNLPILGFRFGRIAFCTDVSTIPMESRSQLQGLDVLILDALRYEPHPTHLHVSAAVRLIEQLNPRQAYLTHMSHDLDYDRLKSELPDGVEPAYDGLKLCFAP
ncbi:MAG: MBL fold metallo-hydrolase [Planctomyces sp.]|nr:MBL fold metallo-hydrolase [Planctomyces sp.]